MRRRGRLAVDVRGEKLMDMKSTGEGFALTSWWRWVGRKEGSFSQGSLASMRRWPTTREGLFPPRHGAGGVTSPLTGTVSGSGCDMDNLTLDPLRLDADIGVKADVAVLEEWSAKTAPLFTVAGE